MELLSARTFLLAVAGFVVYYAIVAVYRLYLCPIAKFPGPKLAALTFWYEFYYDVVKRGKYTFKIKELHEEYGRSCLWQFAPPSKSAHAFCEVQSSVSIHTSFTSTTRITMTWYM